MYSWPLNTNHFDESDRQSISNFILTDSQWTSDKWVIKLEKLWKQYTGYKTILTSSGSTAIELLARIWKEKYGTGNIFLPALTWPTSISPWIQAGFIPIFVDVDKHTLCMSIQDLTQKLENNPPNYGESPTQGIFLTNVLGADIDIWPFKELGRLAIDNCESTFAIGGQSYPITTLTSFYFGHQFTTGTEGGMLFTNDEEEFRLGVYGRGHGLDREYAKYTGKETGQFDFSELGSNFRSNDIAAYMGYLDAQKYKQKKNHRDSLYRAFKDNISDKFKTFDLIGVFAIPIVTDEISKERITNLLGRLGIESRPLISGNLLKHKPFAKYGNPEDFPNAQWLDDNGQYIGIHEGIAEQQVLNLVEELNKL